MEENTILKSVRIPKDMVDEIKRDAKARDTDFSKEVNRRLKHRDDTNYPMFLAKTQTVINLCMEAMNTGNEETIIAAVIARLTSFLLFFMFYLNLSFRKILLFDFVSY